MAETIIYSDIDFDFTQDDEGEIGKLTNLDAIRQSIKNIVLSPIRSRSKYQYPQFGCGVFDLLFDKITRATAILIQEEIIFAIENFEPRVEVIEISVDTSTQTNSYNILIKYRVLAVNIEDDLTLDLEVLK